MNEQVYPGDAVAKAAWEVMMRRGWYAYPASVVGQSLWAVSGMPAAAEREYGNRSFSDPFTALTEADKWYRENVEGKQV